MRTSLLVAISLVFAAFFGQAPEFAQRYAQRLGRAIDELQRIVMHFDEDSWRSGYDRPGALALMGRDQEQLVRDQAARMSETIDRLANLRAQQFGACASQATRGCLSIIGWPGSAANFEGASIAASPCGVLRALFGNFFSLLSGMKTSATL
jgi:Protein of unknown function (DUF2937)